ncbi:MAG: septum formation protein Maf [Butyrivibrio sp.]|nr:septum formation protein Maf [Butyrivibrio sp.]
MVRYILASASPRRQELLAQMGLRFTVWPANGEEVVRDTDPAAVVESLSRQKAEEIDGRLERGERPDAWETGTEASDAVIIAADTVVAIDGQILGKPHDREEAARMIGQLQGRTHHVYTGVTVIIREAGGAVRRVTFHDCTEVQVSGMDTDEISAYVGTGESDDKAGAYGVQGRFACFIDGIRGSYHNVVGLPVAALYQTLRKEGMTDGDL